MAALRVNRTVVPPVHAEHEAGQVQVACRF